MVLVFLQSAFSFASFLWLRLTKKRSPRNLRGGFNLCGDLYRFGLKVFQVLEKSPVLGHALMEQVP